ncbi:MAG TPA: DUF4105 domain-containing protein [Candidatus Avibacteroides excrementipullorum]|nr:DUF4105 domain-containing protein [Candidatus Avibacteroides excrementipullorum]
MKKTILFLLLAVMSSALRAEGKFSLLTCTPGEKIYELFGHTAIRYVEGDSIDLVFNYGMFNFNSPDFIYRFVKGETDYELGIDVYRSFEYSYRRRGSAVYEQKLNLTPDETIMLLHSLLENYKPENRVYRYNYFYDNCTTRAKDMIEKAISGTVEFEPIEGRKTYRSIVHQYTAGHPWSELGIDLCIGSQADKPIDTDAMMFAPFYLLDGLKTAGITRDDGSEESLISGTEMIVSPAHVDNGAVSWPHPLLCAWGLFAIALVAGFFLRRKSWIVDSILFLMAGACGCVLAFLVLFSVHPAVSPNYLLFVFHPLHLFLGVPMTVYCGLKKTRPYYHYFNASLIGLFLILWLFLPQEFNNAVFPLALLLLLRSVSAIYCFRKNVR